MSNNVQKSQFLRYLIIKNLEYQVNDLTNEIWWMKLERETCNRVSSSEYNIFSVQRCNVSVRCSNLIGSLLQ